MLTRTSSWLVFSFAAALPAQTMVADVNTQPPFVDGIGSGPRTFRTLAGLCWFTAADAARGNQLWVSDGTPAGTRVVRMMPRDDLFQPQGFVELNGVVYFTAYSMSEQDALWRSDGTSAGTWVLRNFTPPSLGSALRYLTVANGALWFSASDGQNGEELWRSDGTIAGTQMVIDIDGPASSSLPGPCVPVNGAVLFSARIGSNRELWRSDGTAGGTWQVADIVPGAAGSFPQQLTPLPGGVVFTAATPAVGNELWWSDGTAAGTQLLLDVVPGPNSVQLQKLTAAGPRVYFTAQTASGTELWSTDGTSAGSGIVADLAPGAASSAPDQLTAFGNLLLFSADDGVNGREPWITDGTPAGTSMLADLAAGFASSTPLHFASAGATFYCDAALGTGGRTLCIGTSGIVAPVRNFARVDAIGAFGTSALCCADDGATGPEPWITDGTPAGTTLLLDIQFTARGSAPGGFHAIGDDLVYSTDDGVVGRELWRVPAGGTATLFADIFPGPQSSSPGYLVEYRGWHWFTAYDPVDGNELWRTDGTPAGTQLFADLTPGPASTSPTGLTVAADRLFFISGYTLWANDGTVAGTTPLRTFFQRFPFPSPPAPLAAVAGKLLFTADDVSVGVELWESDGTAAGTVLLRDIHPGAASSAPDRFAVAGDRMFFRANSPLGFELWVSDGTSGGTTGLDLRPGPSSSYPDRITAAGSIVFLTLLDNASVVRLWRSDGTVPGTVQLSAVAVEPRSLTVAGDRLFFSATDSAGREPWVSDGTPAGTFRLRDVWPGSASSMSEIAGFGAAGSGARVVFGANDAVHGVDLWTSDGTPNGTTLLADIAPEILNSNPSGFVRIGTDLFFVADDYAHGPELWRLPLAQLQVPLVDTIAPGCPPIGGATPRLSAVGLPVLGNPSFDLRLEDAPPFTIVLTAFDVVAQPIPVAGCTLAFANPFLLLVGISDGSGVQTTSFSIPVASSLLGLILLEQDVLFDANGPAGLFTMSNALRTMIGR